MVRKAVFTGFRYVVGERFGSGIEMAESAVVRAYPYIPIPVFTEATDDIPVN